MMKTLLSGLQASREQLLKQFMLTKGSDRTEILARIMDLEEEIKEEEENRYS